MTLRLIKFDVIHPYSYLERVRAEWDDLDDLTADEYRSRLIALRSNYSDFYTHWLNQTGEWEAEEFFPNDPVFLMKVARERWGSAALPYSLVSRAIRRLSSDLRTWSEVVVEDYVRRRRPHVIFARSQPIRSRFWQRFRKDSLLVARLSARLPNHWHPNHFDLLFTDEPAYKTFFEMNGVPTVLNAQGFDPRVNSELASGPKRHGTVFIGGLGTANFSRRTRFLAELARRTELDLWGYWWTETGAPSAIGDFPELASRFRGPASGLEMYQIFKDSEIVLNDYVDLDAVTGTGLNQRMFEAMGVGAFMLTRSAANLSRDFPKGLFVTFDDVDDCLDKIAYFRSHPAEREEIGRAASSFVLEHYSYREIALDFGRSVKQALGRKAELS